MPVAFVGGEEGTWRVDRNEPVRGDSLAEVPRLSVIEDGPVPSGVWTLRGVVSYERYVHAAEQAALRDRSPSLGRPEPRGRR